MSFDGQVDWKRIDTGPVWPFAIIGKPSVAAPAATPLAAPRNLRRDVVAAGFATAGAFVLRIMIPPRNGAFAAPIARARRALVKGAYVPLINCAENGRRHYSHALS